MTPFLAGEFLPQPSAFPELLAHIVTFVHQTNLRGPGILIEEFCGPVIPVEASQVSAVDHVAVYAGDYREEEEFSAWLAFLQQQDCLQDLHDGPSHIAQKHYGTQGHWISTRVDSLGIEFFSLYHGGPWVDFTVEKRATRMSHAALRTRTRLEVQPLLTTLAAREGIRLLSYAASDELGHTYGHLLNEDTDQVLEIVHGASP